MLHRRESETLHMNYQQDFHTVHYATVKNGSETDDFSGKTRVINPFTSDSAKSKIDRFSKITNRRSEKQTTVPQ